MVAMNIDTSSDSTAGRKTIWVVDDNQVVTRALARVLKQSGFDPKLFHTGQAALKHPSDPPPAAAVIDIHLPDLSGLELAKSLRQRLGDRIPLIIVSGDTSMENLAALPRVGATYFFSKPLRPAQLLERLRELGIR